MVQIALAGRSRQALCRIRACRCFLLYKLLTILAYQILAIRKMPLAKFVTMENATVVTHHVQMESYVSKEYAKVGYKKYLNEVVNTL